MLSDEKKVYVAERIKHYLKRLRQKNNWSQQDLAKSLGVNRTTVSAYENGKLERNKFVHACEVLWELAVLEGEFYEKFEDFLKYLFQLEAGGSEATNHWQGETLKALNKMSPWMRIRLTEDLLKNPRWESMLQVLFDLRELDQESFASVSHIVGTLARKNR